MVFADLEAANHRLEQHTDVAGAVTSEFRRPDGQPWVIAHGSQPDWERAADLGLVRRVPLWEGVNIEYPVDAEPGVLRRVVQHCLSREEALVYAYEDMPDACRPCAHGWKGWAPVGPFEQRAARRIPTLMSGADGQAEPTPSQPFANLVAATMAQALGLRVHGWVFNQSGQVSFALRDADETASEVRSLTPREQEIADWAADDPGERGFVIIDARQEDTSNGSLVQRFEATRQMAAHVLIPWIDSGWEPLVNHWQWEPATDVPWTALQWARDEYGDSQPPEFWLPLLTEHHRLRDQEG